MDKLQAMAVYSAVVEEQGFSAASRRLGIPLPTVSRKVAELETYLGTPLLIRTTRQVSVTDAGQRYYEDVQSILETVRDVEQRASGAFQQVKGLLTITAPTLFGRLFILPIVTDFMRLHERIDIRLNFTNHVLELPEERIDLGFRIGELPVHGVSSRPIGTVRRVTCGSSDYLQQRGTPERPKDIASHDCILFTRGGGKPVWRFRTPTGQTVTVPVSSRLMINTVEDALDAVMLNHGLSQFFAYQVVSLVDSNRAAIVLADYEESAAPVSLVLPGKERMPQKVQAFCEFAVPVLQKRLEDIGLSIAR